MTPTPSPVSMAPDLLGAKPSPLAVSAFSVVSPRFRSSQAKLLHWLESAHARSGSLSREECQQLLMRYGATPDHIAYRGHEVEDFSHERWEDMRLFGAGPVDLGQRQRVYDESVDRVFDRLYPQGSRAPAHLIHVTCTGYSAPSGAQRLVSRRYWGDRTQVLHAYHMGCFAAHPALRMAAGLDDAHIVHTELCTLHLDPSAHAADQWVIQSLFADGFISYRVHSLETALDQAGDAGVLELLAVRDQVVSDSTKAMRWTPGPLAFDMSLSKDVPVLFASAVPRLMAALFDAAVLDGQVEKQSAVFAIHPGGPRIIELSQRLLGLRPEQVRWSRTVLQEHGNMSSATLPHIWHRILQDPDVAEGTLVVSLGAGPGLTLSGALFRKRLKL